MIATTIEQSRHLLELGLYTKTADMLYYPTAINEMGETMFTLDVKGEYIYQEHEDECIPAWSLSALLEVMPNNDYWDIYLCQAQDVKWQSVFHDCEFSNGEAKDFIEDDPITAAYEMVCWLLEQGLIKKGGQDGNHNH